MRINLNYNNKTPIRIGIFSAIVVVLVGVAILIPRITSLQAVGEEESPLYTFTQTARVFDGENWNEVQQNEDGDYYYYPAGAPDIVEFELAFIVNETFPNEGIKIRNSLPEGMEYINGSLDFGDYDHNSIVLEESQPLTSESRDFALLARSNINGLEYLEYFEPGDNAIITFQAKFLFNNFDSCESVSNMATVSVVYSGEENASTTVRFASPCTGLPRPPEPDPNPTPSPQPDDNKIKTPKTGVFKHETTLLFD